MRKANTPRDLRQMTVTYVEAANFLQIPERRFRDLVEQGVIPKAARGEYELGAVCDAFTKHMSDEDTLKANKNRLLIAQAEKLELENAEERGELHRAEDVAKVWNETIMNAKTRLLAIPTKIAPELIGQDLLTTQAKLKTAINETLLELSEYNEKRIKAAKDV